jgi:hypothetical protein
VNHFAVSLLFAKLLFVDGNVAVRIHISFCCLFSWLLLPIVLILHPPGKRRRAQENRRSSRARQKGLEGIAPRCLIKSQSLRDAISPLPQTIKSHWSYVYFLSRLLKEDIPNTNKIYQPLFIIGALCNMDR